MKFRNTWILAGIAVAFGLYIYFGEFKKAAKEEEEKTANEKVLNVDVAKVKKVEIKNGNGDFVLTKDGEKSWKLESPVKDQGDENMMSGILTALTSAKFDQTIEGEDLKGFGLDSPKSVITVTLQDGATKKVAVGIDASLPGKVYLERNDDKKVLYADSSFKTQLDRNLRDFRDKRIYRKSKDEIQSVIAKYNAKDNHSTVGLLKKGADWWLSDQKEAKADSEVVNSFLSGIDNLRATDFPSEKSGDASELKKYGLDKPEIQIRLEDKDQKLLAEIAVSPKKDNNVYMKTNDSSTIYQGFAGGAEQLVHNPVDFRDKKEPFDINKDEINEILLTSNGKEYHVVKKGTNWEQATPDPKKEVSQIQLTNFLDKVGNLRVSEFVSSEKPKGFDVPKGLLVLKDAKGTSILTVTWGTETKSKRSYFTKTNKVSYVFGTDTTALNGLTGQPLVTDKPVPGASPISGAAAGHMRGAVTETGTAGAQSGPGSKPPVAKPPETIDVKGPSENH